MYMSRTRKNFEHRVCLFLCVTAALLCGQPQTGEIKIQVQDSSGLAMEASGKLESLASKTDRSFQTDAQGTYTFSNLSSGRYRLEVSKDGFATQSMLIDVQSGTPVSRTVTLALPPQASRIDVVAATPLARNRSADRPDPRAGPDGQRARPGAERRAGSFRSAESAAQRRPHQPKPGESIPARRELSRLHGVAACWARRRAFRFTWTGSGRTSRSAISSPGT